MKQRFLLLVIYLLCLSDVYCQPDSIPGFRISGGQEGSYIFNLTRTVRPHESTDTLVFHYKLLQQINESDWTNDRVAILDGLRDSFYLLYYQDQQTLLTRVYRSEFESIEETRLSVEQAPSFSQLNLRRLHNRCKVHASWLFNSCADTSFIDETKVIYHVSVYTYAPPYSRAVTSQADGGPLFRIVVTFTQYQISDNDTLTEIIQLDGARVDENEFMKEYNEAFKQIKTIKPAAPETPTALFTDMVPDFTEIELDSADYVRLDSHEITLGSLLPLYSDGKYKILYFYFNGCIPCMLAKPYIREFNADTLCSVVIVNINDKDTAHILHRLLKDSLTDIPVVMANRQMVDFFSASAAPTTILLDPHNKEISRCTGFDPACYHSMKEIIHSSPSSK